MTLCEKNIVPTGLLPVTATVQSTKDIKTISMCHHGIRKFKIEWENLLTLKWNGAVDERGFRKFAEYEGTRPHLLKLIYIAFFKTL